MNCYKSSVAVRSRFDCYTHYTERRETMKLDQWRKDDVIDSLTTADLKANESTKSACIINTLLGHMCRQDKNLRLLAQRRLEDKSRTDYEITKGGVTIHIVEAKGSVLTPGNEPQLKHYLDLAKCRKGCITDGFNWQFYSLNGEWNKTELVTTGPLRLLRLEVDEIVLGIVSPHINPVEDTKPKLSAVE